jgi:hypothetical protein
MNLVLWITRIIVSAQSNAFHSWAMKWNEPTPTKNCLWKGVLGVDSLIFILVVNGCLGLSSPTVHLRRQCGVFPFSSNSLLYFAPSTVRSHKRGSSFHFSPHAPPTSSRNHFLLIPTFHPSGFQHCWESWRSSEFCFELNDLCQGQIELFDVLVWLSRPIASGSRHSASASHESQNGDSIAHQSSTRARLIISCQFWMHCSCYSQ